MSDAHEQDTGLAVEFWQNREEIVFHDECFHLAATLEKWLREQLRDGGKYKVKVSDFSMEGKVHVFVYEKRLCEKEEFESYEWFLIVEAAGTSDLDALIKAHEEYKEIKP